MGVKRVIGQPAPGGKPCKEPKNNLSPMIDGSTVYSDYLNPDRLYDMLKVPNRCELRVDEYNFPIDQACGDVRCNEHAVLHTLHTLFVR